MLGNTGFDMSCARCGEAVETTAHRLWECRLNLPFRQILDQQLSSLGVLYNLPPCATRCGLFPKANLLSVADSVAIQEYLLGVQAHATDALACFKRGVPIPPPCPDNITRLPLGKIYEVALPPLKKTKRKIDDIQAVGANIIVSSLEVGRNRLDSSQVSDRGFADDDDATSPSPTIYTASQAELFPRLAALPRREYRTDVTLSTDGSATKLDDGARAGWGLTIAIQGAPSLLDFCGPVVTCTWHHLYQGADKLTNNTGELSAIIFALKWLASSPYQGATLEYDSSYAANITCRLNRPHSSFTLALAARLAYDRVGELGKTVTWKKVISHTGDELNERADQLALAGASGILRSRPHALLRQVLQSSRDAPGEY